jgi:hypothetical protein
MDAVNAVDFAVNVLLAGFVGAGGLAAAL